MTCVAILAFLRTYIVMLFMTKIFRWFLYRGGTEKEMETDKW